ncbi:MAG: ribonuclease III domain-containing protein [Clostridiaceae bacterium]|nr:ribonuclease III domain-containing protein [Clostridiaceae bacterium]
MIMPTAAGDLRETPISVLAYIGDAVYELYVRLYTSSHYQGKSGALHRLSVHLVKAGAQAEAMQRLMAVLTDEEAAIFRRGRNSQPGSMSKHADPADYLMATGLEAVIGYLYLKREETRLDHLMAMILEDNTHEPAAQTAAK